MSYVFVADGGDAVWIGSANNPQRAIRDIGVMQRVAAGAAAPALAAASIVYQQSCQTKRAKQVEARAQGMLAESRIFQNWFDCPAPTAVDVLKKIFAEE